MMYKQLPKSEIDDDISALSDTFSFGFPPPDSTGEAIFAAGRFWELESAFGRVDGVVRTVTGYFGGSIAKPSYKDVIEGKTGHTEVVKVTYDKRVITYKSLCKIFWSSHDSTNKDYLRFGVDRHYRSAIFYNTDDEKKQAQETKIKWQMKLNKRIVTKIIPCSSINNLSVFYIAGCEHQKFYLQRDQIRVCECLSLRSTEQFADSFLACKLNGILGKVQEEFAEELKNFMRKYQIENKTMMVLEEIIENLSH